MKKVFWFAAILLVTGINAQSQTRSKKTKAKTTNQSINNRVVNSANEVNLNTTTNYSARANVFPGLKNNYTVSDPILTTLNARANGANIQFNNSGIVGMPKRAYGFANGHILLNTTGAVTSGTQTGSGSVGTGTSLATFGSIGAPMNVNGKSPYAGINMWGNARNMKIIGSDSAVRLTPLKKQ